MSLSSGTRLGTYEILALIANVTRRETLPWRSRQRISERFLSRQARRERDPRLKG